MGLAGLVLTNIYPGSMVGVPGDSFSNMAPPTLCIVALCFFQVGLVELLRPSVSSAWSSRAGRGATTSSTASPCPCSCSTPPAWPSAGAVNYAIAGDISEQTEPTLGWRLWRPLAFIGPLFTLPVIWLFGRRWIRSPTVPRPA